jgi:hypothetical protein
MSFTAKTGNYVVDTKSKFSAKQHASSAQFPNPKFININQKKRYGITCPMPPKSSLSSSMVTSGGKLDIFILLNVNICFLIHVLISFVS